MRWSGGTSRSPIGIDIGSRVIKAAQLSGRGSSAQVHAVAAVPRAKETGPIEPEEIHRLTEVLFRQGFEGRDIVLSAPSETLLVGTLSLPPKHSGAPLDQIARLELGRMHKHDAATFELVHWELPVSSAGGPATATGKSASTSVMAAACPHREAEALLDLFESTDMEVVGLDVSWLALARACAPLLATGQTPNPETATKPDAPQITAILDIGWHTARVIVLRDSIIVFERILTEGGLCKLRDTLKTQLALDDQATTFLLSDIGCSAPRSEASPEDRRAPSEGVDDEFKEPRRFINAHFEALTEELKVSLSYAVQQFRGQGIEKLVLAGGGGAIPRLSELLQAALGFEVAPSDVSKIAHCPRGLDRNAGTTLLTTAVGLAMYEM